MYSLYLSEKKPNTLMNWQISQSDKAAYIHSLWTFKTSKLFKEKQMHFTDL